MQANSSIAPIRITLHSIRGANFHCCPLKLRQIHISYLVVIRCDINGKLKHPLKLPRYFIQQLWKKQMRINILAITISYRGDLPSFWWSRRGLVWRLRSYQSSCWNGPELSRLTALRARVSWSCYLPLLSAWYVEQWFPDSCTSLLRPITCNIEFKITVF